jgi:hypothetical protein
MHDEYSLSKNRCLVENGKRERERVAMSTTELRTEF